MGCYGVWRWAGMWWREAQASAQLASGAGVGLGLAWR
jgi:hypothetical protein